MWRGRFVAIISFIHTPVRPPPGSLQALTQKSSEVELTWKAPNDATLTGYRVERQVADESDNDGRSAEPGGPVQTLVENTGNTATSYTDTTAQEGVQYLYQVKGINYMGTGDGSKWAEARDAPVNTPATGAPSIDGFVRVGETLYADPQPIDDENGLDDVAFSYQWQADGADIADATNWTYTLTGADQGKAIRVRVSFTDEAGFEESVVSAATEPVAGLRPAVPTRLSADAHHDRVELSWRNPGDSTITGYAILRYLRYDDPTGQSRVHVPDTGTADPAYTDTNVQPETHYSYAIRAINEHGMSKWSTRLNAHTPADPTAEQNTPATGQPAVAGTVQVGETLTADTSGIADEDGLDNVAFSYRWLADDADIAGATGSTYTLSDADKGKAIRVRVSFTDDAGNEETLTGPATNAVASAGPTEPPARPSTLTAPEILHDSVTLSWKDPQDDTITGYVILRRDKDIHQEGTFKTVEADTGTADTTYTDTSVYPEKRYVYRIKAINAYDKSEISSWVRAYTPAAPEADENTPATGAPSISGTVQVGETLTADISGIADEDGLDDASFSYQWLSDGTEIAGANGSSYTLADADKGKAIKVRVSFSDDGGNEEALTSDATVAVAAKPNSPATGAPAINGTAQVGETLTADVSSIADEDGLDNVAFTYQWLVDDADISGANGTSYTLADADKGKAIKVRVSFSDGAGNSEELTSDATEAVAARPNSPATGQPTIGGTVQVGQTLTADASGIADKDGLDDATFNYQWLADDVEIAGAAGSRYDLADADEGKAIKARVSFTDDSGNEETRTSAATADVAARPNSPATGAPTISGTAQVGETLTADVSSIADEDGLDNVAFTYQWLADGAEVTGATGSTYTPVAGDVGKAIKVRVSFTDAAGNAESLTSAATAAVAAPPNSPATGQPTISGMAQVGGTLTADSSGIGDEDGLDKATFAYQWLADDAEIAGATNATHPLADADKGKAVKVRVSFTDDAGNAETLTSTATAAVAAKPTPLTAEFRDTPSSHDGRKAFTFELRLSEHFGMSYKTLRDHAFAVTGGEVTNARRLEQGSNVRWEIKVKPDGDGGVTVVLPKTADCNAQGAICTGDGRKLSNRTELTVNGPGG